MISGLQFLAPMNHPTNGRNDVPSRIKRLFFSIMIVALSGAEMLISKSQAIVEVPTLTDRGGIVAASFEQRGETGILTQKIIKILSQVDYLVLDQFEVNNV